MSDRNGLATGSEPLSAKSIRHTAQMILAFAENHQTTGYYVFISDESLRSLGLPTETAAYRASPFAQTYDIADSKYDVQTAHDTSGHSFELSSLEELAGINRRTAQLLFGQHLEKNMAVDQSFRMGK